MVGFSSIHGISQEFVQSLFLIDSDEAMPEERGGMRAHSPELFQADSVPLCCEPALSSGRSRVHVEIDGSAAGEVAGPRSVKMRGHSGSAVLSTTISPEAAMQRGEAMFEQHRFDVAEQYFDDASESLPENADAYIKGARCAYELGKVSVARQRLEAAAKIDPDIGYAHLALGQIYLQDGMIHDALASSGRAMQLRPGDDRATVLHATALQYAGESPVAWELVREIIRRGGKSPRVVALYAEMAFARGEAEPAMQLIDELLASRRCSIPDESALRFAAGGLLDRMQRYDDAFAHAKRANHIRSLPYDADLFDRQIDKSIAYFTSRRLRCLPKASYRDAKPVFVVGMPRSGTSLLEQMLASHAGIYGAG